MSLIKKYLSREKFNASPLAKLGALPAGSGDLGLYKIASLVSIKAPDALALKAPDGTEEAGRVSKDFIISTEAVDRDNDTIALSGWKLDAFRKNGAVLWAHDNKTPNIATPFETRITDAELRSGAVFPTKAEYEFGALIGRLVDLGLVKNTSVGFIPHKWVWNEQRGGFDFVEQELAEFSIVPVGSNPDAMEASATKAGLDLHTLHGWGVKFLDNDDSARGYFAEREHVEKMVACLQKSHGARTVDAGALTAAGTQTEGEESPAGGVGSDTSAPVSDGSAPATKAALVVIADALDTLGSAKASAAAALLRAPDEAPTLPEAEPTPEPAAPALTAKEVTAIFREELAAQRTQKSVHDVLQEEMQEFKKDLRRTLFGRLD